MFNKYLKTNQYLNELIRPSLPDLQNSGTHREWMLRFLDDLDHPEKACPAIHIAGTSGKGSTALNIACALKNAGYKVGLHTSPYLQVATEKLWCNGSYASSEEFCDLVDWIRPICEKWRAPDAPLHAMSAFAISLEHFRRKKIDIAVIETSVGGRDDVTNVLNTALSVITPIGIDHTLTLGNTIEKIATHKAGIIKRGVPVVAFKGAGAEVIERTAKEKNAPLWWYSAPADSKSDFRETNSGITKLVIERFVSGAPSPCPLPSAKRPADRRGERVRERVTAREGLPARMEILQEGPRIIIDGAHNGQKLSALFEAVRNESFSVCIFGMLESKIDPAITDLLKEIDTGLILTEPRVYGKTAAKPSKMDRLIGKKDTIIEPDPAAALDIAKKISDGGGILVTGSLYLCGNIRELYYPSQKILEQQTSWPV